MHLMTRAVFRNFPAEQPEQSSLIVANTLFVSYLNSEVKPFCLLGVFTKRNYKEHWKQNPFITQNTMQSKILT